MSAHLQPAAVPKEQLVPFAALGLATQADWIPVTTVLIPRSPQKPALCSPVSTSIFLQKGITLFGHGLGPSHFICLEYHQEVNQSPPDILSRKRASGDVTVPRSPAIGHSLTQPMDTSCHQLRVQPLLGPGVPGKPRGQKAHSMECAVLVGRHANPGPPALQCLSLVLGQAHAPPRARDPAQHSRGGGQCLLCQAVRALLVLTLPPIWGQAEILSKAQRDEMTCPGPHS